MLYGDLFGSIITYAFNILINGLPNIQIQRNTQTNHHTQTNTYIPTLTHINSHTFIIIRFYYISLGVYLPFMFLYCINLYTIEVS